MKTKISLLISSLFGAVIVAFYDIGLNDQQSVVMKTGEIVRQYFISYWDSSAWAGLSAVLIVTAFFHHMRSPQSKKAACELGLGIISVIATIMSPLKHESIGKRHTVSFSIEEKAWAEEDSQTHNGWKASAVVVPGNGNEIVRYQIRDANSDAIVKSESVKSGKPISIENLDTAKSYFLYVEASGQRWTKVKVKPQEGAPQLNVIPSDSRMPISVQRFLGTSKPERIEQVPASK
jgi:hypothetical protein